MDRDATQIGDHAIESQHDGDNLGHAFDANSQSYVETVAARPPLPSLQSIQILAADNKAIQSAIDRIRDRVRPIHTSHHTKHSSHATHSKGSW